jgi:hypothetical protein
MISNQAVGTIYVANGVTSNFAIPFDFILGEAASVVRAYTVDILTGDLSLLINPTHYTLTPAENVPANIKPTTVAFHVPPANGTLIYVTREQVFTQSVQYVNNSSFLAKDHEKAIDRIVLMAQEIKNKQTRSIDLNILDQHIDPVLPPLVAECTIVVNALGTGFEVGPSFSTITGIEANVLAAAAAAAASEASALGSASAALISENNAAGSASAALISENNAAGSASAALVSENNAAGSASAALISENNAAASEAAALAAAIPGAPFKIAGYNSLGVLGPVTELEFSAVSSLELTGTTKALRIPVLTTAQRNALTPLSGMLIFNSTESEAQFYDGTNWQASGGGAITVIGSMASPRLIGTDLKEADGHMSTTAREQLIFVRSSGGASTIQYDADPTLIDDHTIIGARMTLMAGNSASDNLLSTVINDKQMWFNTDSSLTLMWDGVKWREVSRSE